MESTFDITIGDEPKSIKMTFGLLNVLCKAVGDIDGAATIVMDNALRDAVLTELLSERNKDGKITKPINLVYLELDPDDAADLLSWAGEHIMDFFLKGLEKAKALQDNNLARIEALMPTSSGSAA